MLPAAMRRGVIAAGLAGALSLTAAPALGGQPPRTVAAGADNQFFPAKLTVVPGTQVNWENRGLQHNVKFDDGSFEQPANPSSTPWRVWRTFDKPGTYRYYCETHGGKGGAGMSGVVVVKANVLPKMTGLTVRPRKVCNRRKGKCCKTKIVVRFKLSEKALIAGRIDAVGKPKGRRGLDIGWRAKQGRNTHRISVRKLRPGRYRLRLTAEDNNGNESNPATAFFRVKAVRRARRR